jgi:hypothetical protein
MAQIRQSQPFRKVLVGVAACQRPGRLEGGVRRAFPRYSIFLRALSPRFLFLFEAVDSCIYDGVGVEASGIWHLEFSNFFAVCMDGWHD